MKKLIPEEMITHRYRNISVCENAHIWSAGFKNFQIGAQSRGLRCHSILNLWRLFCSHLTVRIKQITRKTTRDKRTLICIEEQWTTRNRRTVSTNRVSADYMYMLRVCTVHGTISAQPGPILVGPGSAWPNAMPEESSPEQRRPARADL